MTTEPALAWLPSQVLALLRAARILDLVWVRSRRAKQANPYKFACKKASLKGGEIFITVPSLLSYEAVRPILELAKKNLVSDGFLQPVLFVTLGTGQRLICGVELPQTFEQRREYFQRLGASFQQDRKVVREALFLSEGWYVNVRTSPGAFAVPPSRHPQREETITVIGRDAAKTRVTFLVVPFKRVANGELVWQPIGFATYAAPTGEEMGVSGFLDDFFEGYLREPPPKNRRGC